MRVVLVSNRLPVSIRSAHGDMEVRPSAGGLATGLGSFHREGDSLWVGWPGDFVPPALRGSVDAQLAAMRCVPVYLSQGEMQRFYDGVSNGVLWPLFHYLLDRIPLHARDWDSYVQANERFADVVAEHARPDDCIWVHDYHLMLLPLLLRARLPDASIGFFLHIPFPSSDVFLTLPWRAQLLQGMLGADLIGFHTFTYLRHFGTALLRVLGIEASIDRVEHDGRSIRLGAFPMGIDAAAYASRASSPEVARERSSLRAAHGGVCLLLGIDRLDYTKGIRRRLLAFARLLERRPQLRGRVRLVQVCVPSRELAEQYKALRAEVEELVGRINGTYSSLGGSPVHYVYRSLSPVQLSAAYLAADVMLVTPLRDGMNLVAKEYVASRVDGDGVLVLSELAGAATELGEALLVNPYDVEGMAEAMALAVVLPEEERRRRMSALRERVLSRPVADWAASFLASLRDAGREDRRAPPRLSDRHFESLAQAAASASGVVLLLDYDGTLVELQPTPDLARPTAELRQILASLAGLDGVWLHVVSGRARETLDAWLSGLPIGLHAEHGLWSRWRDGPWEVAVEVPAPGWMDHVRPVLEEYAALTPGAWVEEKSASLAWHYRGADPQLGTSQARELRLHLVQSLAQRPLDVLAGHKVIEVRPQGASKGLASRKAVSMAPTGSLIVALGDDRTDVDMFAALPPDAVTFAVGALAVRATYRLDGPSHVRELLKRLDRSLRELRREG